MGRQLHIAALGSSFAAGPGIQPVIEKNALRSARNYAHQLAEKLDANLTDLTCSGCTLINVLSDPFITYKGAHFDPQLDHLPDDVDIVTLTAGGNDLGYSGGMILESLFSYFGPLKSILRRWFLPATDSLSSEQLTERFTRVIDRIHEVAPKAKIYLVEYHSVFGEATKPRQDIPLMEEQIQKYRQQASVLSDANRRAANMRPRVEVVPMSTESAGHELGTHTPWVTGFSLSMFLQGVTPLHPNLAGHTATAETLYQQIVADRATHTA